MKWFTVLKSPAMIMSHVLKSANAVTCHADNVQLTGGGLMLVISAVQIKKTICWMDYKKSKSVDTSTAPEISWPDYRSVGHSISGAPEVSTIPVRPVIQPQLYCAVLTFQRQYRFTSHVYCSLSVCQ
ncbi:tail fiber assembly protein [Escherichia coli]|uniref:tail fiber assembly protein n=1 Tax=Escherichia coli TaxID=562 RepID=UPI00202BAA4C|nr:tail fiber assembly protein [Escherichia coli]